MLLRVPRSLLALCTNTCLMRSLRHTAKINASEDTEALARILLKTRKDASEANKHGVTLTCMTSRLIQQSELISAKKSIYENMSRSISESMGRKRGQKEIEYKYSRKRKEKGEKRAILAILALPNRFCEINKKNS